MHHRWHLRHLPVSLLAIRLALLGAAPAMAYDTYNATDNTVTAPSVAIGNATLSNVVFTVGEVLSGPTGAAPEGDEDSYDPASGQMTVPAALVAGTVSYNYVGYPGLLLSIGTVTGADTYDGTKLTIGSVQVDGGAIYTNVAVTVTALGVAAGGFPGQALDTYDSAQNLLTIPVLQIGGSVLTNLTATVDRVVSVGGADVSSIGVVVYSFRGSPAIYGNGSADGQSPEAGLIQGSDGRFYGTTGGGGTSAQGGTLFSITPSGSLTLLYSFAGTCEPGSGTCTGDGAYPAAGVIEATDGRFYGTTLGGGVAGAGTVYSFSTGSGTETVLHSFGTGTDGTAPLGGVIQGSDGFFYGTTSSGGDFDAGVVYRLDSSGNYTVLYDFTSGSTFSTAQSELYDPSAQTWSTTGSLATARFNHTATLLPGGQVLVAGGVTGGTNAIASAELYSAGSWSSAGSMATAREVQTATLLGSGKVLVAGGYDGNGFVASAELYDPAGNTWSMTGSLANARNNDTATLLPGGSVLVAGGYGLAGPLAAAELYDPASGTWSSGGTPSTARYAHTATLLPNGKVLIAGGVNSINWLASAELYDPATNSWSSAGSMATARNYHTATLLPNGKVLVAGGFTVNNAATATAELYDPASNSWYSAGSLSAARLNHTATLLPSGQVLVTGGTNNTALLASAEVYNPSTNAWSGAASLPMALASQTATLLTNNTVLVAGGTGFGQLNGTQGGAQPQAGLILATDGNYYGTTVSGGAGGAGTVFEITSTGVETILYSFGATQTDGASPVGGLVQGSDGYLYGTTFAGGQYNQGTVFRLALNGTYAQLHSFSGNGGLAGSTDGAQPMSALIEGSDGSFYGTASAGGTQNSGVAFRITTAGIVTVLHSFSGNGGLADSTDGAQPVGSLASDGNGNLYGTTIAGGTLDFGSIFKLGSVVSPAQGGAGALTPQRPR